MSSTSANRNESNASNRSHNQGRQTRDYTPAQAAAVNRVRKCKHFEYYAILDIERTAEDGEIKRAYRKLALLMHPDKNGAPGADEAFKMVSKAFQILSDKDKKRAYDATGTDPDSRASGMPSGFSRRSSAAAGGGGFGGGGMYGDDISPEELFNMFFGGGGGGGGPGFQTGFGGFGGPGVRIHSFGGSPFTQFQFGGRGGPQAGHQQRQQAGGGDGDTISFKTLVQLLPLLILFIFPLLSSLFDSGSSSNDSFWRNQAHFEFTPAAPYTSQRVTPKYNVPYYVNPKDLTNLNDKRLSQLDQRAENSYIRVLRNKCDIEHDIRQRKIEDSQGWFFVDEKKYEKAINMKMESCDALKSMGFQSGRR
ncbi:hypothetical protein V1514DRAFT_326824 [Lipomyces japonicus]|uniref:uncharacterized protein n=1 Tax=Lipomyces japonicus TaxID=56871 RepID=UPI0034CEF43A